MESTGKDGEKKQREREVPIRVERSPVPLAVRAGEELPGERTASPDGGSQENTNRLFLEGWLHWEKHGHSLPADYLLSPLVLFLAACLTFLLPHCPPPLPPSYPERLNRAADTCRILTTSSALGCALPPKQLCPGARRQRQAAAISVTTERRWEGDGTQDGKVMGHVHVFRPPGAALGTH